MKTKDALKEEIGLNKLLITICSAVDFSLISTIWKSNFVIDKHSIMVWILVIYLTILLFTIYNDTTTKIKELDNYV